MTKSQPRTRQPQPKAIPIYRSDGAAVGRVVGDTFQKRARSSVHMLQRPRAWAADCDTLDQAIAAGASRMVILDQDTGSTYTAALTDFFTYGVKVRRGHGDQLALPLARWSVTRRRSPAVGPGAAVDTLTQQLRLL